MSKTTNKFSPEVRERAVRMVDEHRADYGSEWAAMTSIAGNMSDPDHEGVCCGLMIPTNRIQLVVEADG